MTHGLYYLLTYLNALNTGCKYIVSMDTTLLVKNKSNPPSSSYVHKQMNSITL